MGKPRQSGGFTLIELLIVLAIIAILAAIAVPNFLEAMVRAKVARCRSDMRTIAVALESYAADHTSYPPMLGSSADGTGQLHNERNGYGSVRLNPWRGTPHQLTTPVSYLSQIPADVFKQGAVATQGDDNATPDVGKSFVNGNPFDASFVYHNVLQYTSASGGEGGFANADLARYGMWRLYSLGPDQYFNAIETLDLTTGALYDPTNGSRSAGELVRTQVER